MVVTLIGKNKMYKTTLPQFVRGNYAIHDNNDKKIINIESINGNWQIISNNNFKIIDPKEIETMNSSKMSKRTREKTIDNAILKEYSTYYILFSHSKEIWVLHCAPTLEEFMHLDIKTSSEIIVGSDKKCDILYDSILMKNKQIRIFYNNGRLLLENFDEEFGSFINNKPVRK